MTKFTDKRAKVCVFSIKLEQQKMNKQLTLLLVLLLSFSINAQKETKEIDGVQFNILRKVEDGFIIKNIEIKHNEDRFYFQEKVKALTKEKFSEILTFAGLQIIDTFGNYKLDEFNHQTSDRLIIISKK